MKIVLRTDIGQKRSSNQDYVNKFVNKAEICLVLLADGLGGHKAGDIASQSTVNDLGRAWVNTALTDLEDIRDWLQGHIEEENQKIYQMGQMEDFKDMSTTLEAVVILGDYIIHAHIGDSRIGLIRDGVYHGLTRDHSYVNALIDLGEITPEEAEVHPQRNFILQSIGQKDPVRVDIGTQQIFPGDYILANSDGLTDMVEDHEIEQVLRQDMDLTAKADLLVTMANEAGGLDNITLALIAVEGGNGL